MVNTTILYLLAFLMAFSVSSTPGSGVEGMLSKVRPNCWMRSRVRASICPSLTSTAFSTSESVKALLP